MSRKEPSFLVRQPHGYCFRINVPKDLRAVVALHEIRYSLQTRDYLHAKSQALSLGVQIRRLFSELRRSNNLPHLSPKDLKRIIKEFILSELSRADKQRLLFDNLTPALQQDIKNEYANISYQSYLAFTQRQYHRVYDLARSLLKDNGLDTPAEDSTEFRELCRELIRATGFVAGVNIDREDGVYDSGREHDPDFYDKYLTEPVSAPIPPAAPVDDSPLLSEAIDRFLTERTNARNWKKYYRKEMVACLNTFQEFVGEDIQTSQISSKLLVSFKDALMRLPANRNKIKEYRDKSLKEILEMPVSKPMASNTVDKYLTRLGTFLNYAKNHGFVAENYATGMKIKPIVRDDEERDGFTAQDMHHIFNSPEYQNDSFKYRWEFWAPFFAAYAGLRANEIGQLYVEDIYQVDGIWVVDVNANGPDKTLKTNTNSKRIVPLHPIFIQKGLPEYIAEMKAQGATRLFPDLNGGVKGYGDRISRAFNGNGHYRGYLRRWGVKGPHDKGRKVFHSFRHTFATHLQEKDVPEVNVLRLMGHKTGYEGLDRYTKSTLVERLYNEAIIKIDYTLKGTRPHTGKMC